MVVNEYFEKRHSAAPPGWMANAMGVDLIEPQDVTDAADPVQTGLEREVAEEVEMPPGWMARPIGVLNNDLEPVGRVHFGLVYIADLASPAVRVKETNKLEGAFATLDEIRTAYDRLETWSQLVVDAIDLREI